MADAKVRAAVTAEAARRAAWRLWAAEVRDRQGLHAGLSDEVAGLAGLLAQVLDAIDQAERTAAARNLVAGLGETAAQLIGLLLEAGVPPPALPA
jgi:hypothetical protein